MNVTTEEPWRYCIRSKLMIFKAHSKLIVHHFGMTFRSSVHSLWNATEDIMCFPEEVVAGKLRKIQSRRIEEDSPILFVLVLH